MKKECIVLSAINIFEGGPLSVLKDCLSILNKYKSSEFTIIIFVHKKIIINSLKYKTLKFVEFPKSRSSYIYRLYYEFYFFNRISIRIKPKYWFSFHDITPNLTSTKQFVYCHNPSPFNLLNIFVSYYYPNRIK